MAEVAVLDAGGDANRAYVVLERPERRAFCVDPSYAAEAVERVCREAGCVLTDVLLTHSHRDHWASLPRLVQVFGPRILVHPAEGSPPPGARFFTAEGPLPGLPRVEVLFTPGHSPGGVCFRFEDRLFTGDTLFVDWVGRWDLPGGSGEALFQSLARLRSLAPALRLHPGHHYGTVESRTLGEEIGTNRFLREEDLGAFLALLPELTA
jgi:glyoxylase-like metal-dependent hydrolase (beta-lactamase superfamily II)